MAKPAKPDSGFYPAAEIALIFDFSVSYFNQSIRPHLPPSAILTRGRQSLFRASSITDLLVQRQATEHRSSSPLDVRLMRARADHAETAARLAALQEEKTLEQHRNRQATLIEVADLEQTLQHIVATLREVAGRFTKRSTLRGEDAQEMLNQALETLEREADDVIEAGP